MKLTDVSQNYDTASMWYDTIVNFVFHRLLGLASQRRAAVASLGDLSGQHVLDIGCGTGSNFPYLLETLRPKGRIIGLDYSSGMLAKAKTKIRDQGWQDLIELKQGDAASLRDFAPASMDAVISVWCLGIVHDLDGAIKEALRVLKPGGHIAIMDFGRSKPESGWLRWLSPLYHFLLKKSGIDTAEDLDDEKLRQKWERGTRLLRESLHDYQEATYLQGLGLTISGQKPFGRTQPH